MTGKGSRREDAGEIYNKMILTILCDAQYNAVEVILWARMNWCKAIVRSSAGAA